MSDYNETTPDALIEVAMREIFRTYASNVVEFRYREANLGSEVFGDAFITKLMPWSVGVSSPPDGPLGRNAYHIVPPNSRFKITGQSSAGTIAAFAGLFGVFLDIPT